MTKSPIFSTIFVQVNLNIVKRVSEAFKPRTIGINTENDIIYRGHNLSSRVHLALSHPIIHFLPSSSQGVPPLQRSHREDG